MFQLQYTNNEVDIEDLKKKKEISKHFHEKKEEEKIISTIQSQREETTTTRKDIMADRFFKVVEIEAKNFGCVAIKEIPQGNLILQEQPQCVAQWSDPEYTHGGVNR